MSVREHGAAPVTLTISCASFPDDGRDRHDLLRAADRRLHAVKDTRLAAPRGTGFGPAPAFGAV